MNTIKQDNTKHLQRFIETPPNPHYIAGFIDGDGNIFIRKIKDGFQSGISITQCRTNILQILKYHYGGYIVQDYTVLDSEISIEDDLYLTNSRRNCFNYIIRSYEYHFLIEDIYDKIILKEQQMISLKEFSSICNKKNCKEQKEKLFELVSNKNIEKINSTYDISRINDAYIAGLFDSEGSIFCSPDKNGKFTKGIYMKITQKNHPAILKYIKDFLGFGNTTEINYIIQNAKDCLIFIKKIKDYCIVKKNQLDIFENYLKTINNDIYTNEINEKRKEYFKIINKEKHESEMFEELEESIEKKKFNEKNQKKENDSKKQHIEEVNEKMKIFYKNKSESMKGENNINFGGLNEKHILNIAIGITKSKRQNWSDEKILRVLDQKGKITQIQCAKMFETNRNQISRIWKGEMLPLSHENFVSQKKNKIGEEKKEEIAKFTSSQKTSISKRKVSIDEIIEILLMKQRKNNNEKVDKKIISSTYASNYFSNRWNKKITVDIIKYIWSGKTKIFESEFEEKRMNYQEYLKIIDK